MTFEISDEIKKMTKCLFNFECLNSNHCNICPIERKFDGILLATDEKKQKAGCAYLIPFGYRHFCKCPVRIELFERYKI